mmetsp:Transcript_102768/g.257763  ORF Transcript_102768/g.257763 Transcript_102768/m.257763 type:complete len:239 (-) Transcript_102768:26-742(-)
MGSSCSVSWSSDLDHAAKEIKTQLATLEASITKSDLEIREHVARANIDPLAHQRALNSMKKKKLFEEQRRQLIGAQFNIDSLVFQRDQAKVTLNAVKALEKGTQKLRADQLQMDPGKVEDLCDDAAMLGDEMRAIGDSLAASYALGDWNDEAAEALDREYLSFDKQYAKLSAESNRITTSNSRLSMAAAATSSAALAAGKSPAASLAATALAGASPAALPSGFAPAASSVQRLLVGEH